MKIKLFDQDNKKVWEKEIDKTEYKHLRTITNPDLTNTSAGTQFLIPVRTHSAKNLAVDLFSPMFVGQLCYRGYPRDLSCAKHLEVIPLVLLELVTLPVRLATLFPRVIYNEAKPEHPFRTWLYNEGVSADYFLADSIKIKIETDPKIRGYGATYNYDETEGRRVEIRSPNYYKKVISFRVNFVAQHCLFNESWSSRLKGVKSDEPIQECAPGHRPRSFSI